MEIICTHPTIHDTHELRMGREERDKLLERENPFSLSKSLMHPQTRTHIQKQTNSHWMGLRMLKHFPLHANKLTYTQKN